jgi:hypothetical protein
LDWEKDFLEMPLKDAIAGGYIRPGDPEYNRKWDRNPSPEPTIRSRYEEEPQTRAFAHVGERHMPIPQLSNDYGASSVNEVPLYKNQEQRHLTEENLHLLQKPYKQNPNARVANLDSRITDAERFLDKANPLSQENVDQNTAIANRLKSLADTPTDAKTLRYERELEQNPLDQAHHYRNDFEEEVIEALKNRHREDLSQELNALNSDPRFTQHGVRQVNAITEAKRTTKAQREREFKDRLALLKYNAWDRAHGLAQSQQGVTIGKLNTLGVLSQEDARRRQLATQVLKDVNTQDTDKFYKHAGHKAKFGNAAMAREQAALDVKNQDWIAKQEHDDKRLRRAIENSNHLPISASISHHIRESAAPIYSGPMGMIGEALTSLGTQFLPQRSAKGGRIKERHAEGDSIGEQAMDNAVIDNTDPLSAYHRLVRHQLLSGLLQYKSAKKKAMKSGGSTSPIAAGVESAHNLLNKKHLEEAQRLQQPMGEEHFLTKVARSLAPALENAGGHYAGAGRGIQAGLNQNDLREQTNAKRRAKGFDIEREHAKELAAEQRYKEERDRLQKNADRAYNLQAKKLDQQYALLKERSVAKSNAPEKFNSERIKAEERFLDTLKDGLKIKREVARVRELQKKVGSGPIAGGLSSIAPNLGSEYAASFLGAGNSEDQQDYKAASGNLSTLTSKNGKNIPKDLMKKLEASAPSITKSPEANKIGEEMYEALGEDYLSKARQLGLLLGYTPEQIAKLESDLANNDLDLDSKRTQKNSDSDFESEEIKEGDDDYSDDDNYSNEDVLKALRS